MSDTRSLITLIPKLVSATNAKKLPWQRRPNSSFFSVPVEPFTVMVWEWSEPANPEVSGITAQLTDKDGTVIDEIVGDEFSAGFTKLRELHQAARRSAFKVDDVIAHIEKRLEDL